MYLVHLSPLENKSVFIHFYPFFLKPEPHPQAYEMPQDVPEPEDWWSLPGRWFKTSP